MLEAKNNYLLDAKGMFVEAWLAMTLPDSILEDADALVAQSLLLEPGL